MDEESSAEEISKQLGMKPEEIFRLSDFSREDFLDIMTEGVEGYSKAQLVTKITHSRAGRHTAGRRRSPVFSYFAQKK